MIIFCERMLRNAVKNYVERYHTERNHQGLDNRIIDAHELVGLAEDQIVCRERLGGLLKHYQRRTA
jgi:putative transposase